MTRIVMRLRRTLTDLQKSDTLKSLLFGLLLVATVAGVGTLCVLAFLRWIPEAIIPSHTQPPTRVDEIAKARTALLTLMAGLIAVAGAIYTVKTFRLSRQGQITDRLTRAIDQLGSDHVDIRLGSIYALERLARESPGDQGQIMAILTGYVRQHAPWLPASGQDETEASPADPKFKPPADIHAALRAIGRRNTKADRKSASFIIDLSGTDLRGLPFDRGDFARAYFVGAHLDCADLSKTNLSNADFGRAHVEHADLTGATLDDANLAESHLKHTELRFARLRGARLRDADLADANLFGAVLDHADLWKATLVRASLWNVQLASAADLTAADFTDVRQNDQTTWPADFGASKT